MPYRQSPEVLCVLLAVWHRTFFVRKVFWLGMVPLFAQNATDCIWQERAISTVCAPMSAKQLCCHPLNPPNASLEIQACIAAAEVQ